MSREQDLGSVGSGLTPLVPSPSLADEPATPLKPGKKGGMATIDRPAEFWLIWSVGERNSSRSHRTKESADREAERLAQKHPFRNFFVVRAERQVRHAFLYPLKASQTTPASDGEVRDAHSAPNDRTQDHPPGGHSHEG